MPDSQPEATVDAVPRRFLLVVNPTAGRAATRRLEAVRAQLQARGCGVSVHWTRFVGDAENQAAAADAADIDVIVAAGGDGTIREVLNGLAVARDRAPALAVLPLGTANVMALELGLPRDVADLARVLAEGPVRPVRFGVVAADGGPPRLFANMAGAGFDARCVATVSLRWKRLIGGAAYGLAALGQLLRRQPLLRVRLDGEEREVASLVVTKMRYYAGPYVLAPAARLDDGRLHVCLFERSGPAATLGYSLALLRNRIGAHPGFEVRSAERVEILGPAGEPLQADGDRVANLPVSITLDPQSLRVVTPEGWR